ncbi:MAG: Uncharacterised protein [Bacteroidota bacterium]|nr:MAG: Uncharacterised protein [Bacteroidota bacterium]
MRPVFCTFKKFTKIPCAVSGRKYNSVALSADAPNLVPNIRLNCLTSVQFLDPDKGHTISNSSMSAFTSAKSSFSNDFPKRFKMASPFSL